MSKQEWGNSKIMKPYSVELRAIGKARREIADELNLIFDQIVKVN